MGLLNFLESTRNSCGKYKTKKIKCIILSWNNLHFELNTKTKYLTMYYMPSKKDMYTLVGIPNTQCIVLNDNELNTCLAQVKISLETVTFLEKLPVLGLPGASFDAYMWCKYDSKDLYYTNTSSEGFMLRKDTVDETFIQLFNLLKEKFATQ